MVVFDIDVKPSLRRHDPHFNQETIDVTRTTTATATRTDPTAAPTLTAAQNDSGSPSRSSSSHRFLSPNISIHSPGKKRAGNAPSSPAAATRATGVVAGSTSPSIGTTATTSSYSSLSSMETDDDDNNNNNNNNGVLVVVQPHPQQQQQLQKQAQQSQQQQFLLAKQQKRRVTFSGSHAVTIIHDDPFLFTDYEKSVCFCSRKDRALFEQDRISVYSSYDRHMKYGMTWKETDQITLRGLEDFFGMRSKEEIRHEHVVKVLNEQARQRQLRLLHGGPALDADTLRYVSSESSAEGRQRAAAVGRDDATIAQRCYSADCGGGGETTTNTTKNSKSSNNGNTMTHHHHASSSCHVTCLASWGQQWF